MKDYGWEVWPSASVIIVIRHLTWLVSLQVLPHPHNSRSAAPATSVDSCLRPVTTFTLQSVPSCGHKQPTIYSDKKTAQNFLRHSHFNLWLKCQSVTGHNVYLVRISRRSSKTLMEFSAFYILSPPYLSQIRVKIQSRLNKLLSWCSVLTEV